MGGTITYTIVLTNNGTGVQGDNAGNEFTDTLPAGLTLVSANATSGTRQHGHQHGDLERLHPGRRLGDHHHHRRPSTPAPPAQTITNQGTLSFDSNGDGTNDTSGDDGQPGDPGSW